jgi:hypothetical protein
MKYIKRLDLQQKYLLLLFVSWMIVQGALLYHYGIITSNEAVKYTREAHNILAHQNFSEQKYIFYSVYIFIHILFIKSGFETTGVYIFQLLLNLTATYLFYKTANTVYQNKRIAFVAALLLIVCIPFQYWTICLYTESLFCSLIIIFLYCLFGINKSNRIKYTYGALVFLLLLFSRPTGIFFMAVITTMIFYRFLKSGKILAAISGLLLFTAGSIFFLYYEMNSASSYNFIKPFLEHYVICDVPYPGSTAQANIYGSGIKAVLSYAQDYTREFLHLCFLRFISFWSLARPFYSGLHNWMLRIFFYPLYLFAVISIIKQWKTKPALLIFCLAALGVFTASVMLTCDEWSSRFIMPVIPVMIFLAAHGIVATFNKRL